MCDHHLDDGPLVCTRADLHTTGHTYTASEAPDRHTHEPSDD